MSRPLLAALALAASTLAAAALELTPSQTEGPYYPTRKPAETDSDLTRVGNGPQAKGDVLVLKGTVVDPAGKPLPDARVEIWQTDVNGVYLHPRDPGTERRDRNFQFYGEARADAEGRFGFRTIMPAIYGGRARHIHVKVHPPGGPTLTTQLYFADDPQLRSDGLAASAGKRLELITLKPAGTPPEATVTFVVRAGKGR